MTTTTVSPTRYLRTDNATFILASLRSAQFNAERDACGHEHRLSSMIQDIIDYVEGNMVRPEKATDYTPTASITQTRTLTPAEQLNVPYVPDVKPAIIEASWQEKANAVEAELTREATVSVPVAPMPTELDKTNDAAFGEVIDTTDETSLSEVKAPVEAPSKSRAKPKKSVKHDAHVALFKAQPKVRKPRTSRVMRQKDAPVVEPIKPVLDATRISPTPKTNPKLARYTSNDLIGELAARLGVNPADLIRRIQA